MRPSCIYYGCTNRVDVSSFCTIFANWAYLIVQKSCQNRACQAVCLILLFFCAESSVQAEAFVLGDVALLVGKSGDDESAAYF